VTGIPYCVDHDPLVLAGFVSCPRCGRVAYPVDAAWLDGRLVLASFPPACPHTRAVVWLGNPADLRRQRARWCHVRTRATGDPCRNRSRDGGPCRIHGGR
jgi:hypothetical protein